MLEVSLGADRTTALVGEAVGFTYLVRNVGTETVSGIEGQDQLGFFFRFEDCAVSGANVPFSVTLTPDDGLIGGPDELICTSSYVPSAADGNAGSVTNQATVFSDQLPPTSSNAVALTITPVGELTVTLEADRATAEVGEAIAFSAVVRSIGAHPVTGIEGQYALGFFFRSESCTVGGANVSFPATLAPDDGLTGGPDELVCVSTYTPTAGDAVAGSVTNRAQVIADHLPPAVSNDVTVTVTPGGTPALEVTLEADRATARVGEGIGFSYRVRSLGTEAVTGIEGQDALGFHFGFGSCEVDGAHAPFPITLAPDDGAAGGQDELICATIYIVTGADGFAGSVTNEATVFSNELPAVTSNSVTVTVTPAGTMAVEATLTADRATAAVGDTIVYTATIHSTGTLPVSGTPSNAFSIVVIFRESSAEPACTVNGVPVAVADLLLAPDEGAAGGPDEAICTVSYVVTAADGAAHQAIADLQVYPGPADPVFAPPVTVDVGVAGLVVTLEADRATAQVNEGILFTTTIRNTGTEPVTGIEVQDLLGSSFGFGTCTIDGSRAPFPVALAPDDGVSGGPDELVCTINYIVTAADRFAGSVTNQVLASSTELATVASNPITVAVLP